MRVCKVHSGNPVIQVLIASLKKNSTFFCFMTPVVYHAFYSLRIALRFDLRIAIWAEIFVLPGLFTICKILDVTLFFLFCASAHLFLLHRQKTRWLQMKPFLHIRLSPSLKRGRNAFMSDNAVCVRVCECREDTRTRRKKSSMKRLILGLVSAKLRLSLSLYIYIKRNNTLQVEMDFL